MFQVVKMMKDMKKNYLVIFVFLIFCQSGFGQQGINFYDSKIDQTKPFLISSVSAKSEDGGEKLFHTLEQAYAAFRNDGEFSLALRVCSDFALPVIFTDSYYSPSYKAYLIKERFGGIQGINLDKVFLLRNDKNCIENEKFKITEFWLVPKDSDFPEFVEIAQMNDFQIYSTEKFGIYRRKILISSFKVDTEFISAEKSEEPVLLTLSNYPIFKNNLLGLLRKDKFSFILIEYPNYGKVKKNIYNQALDLKTFLTKNHIRENRIFLKSCDSDECEFDFSIKNSIYPNVISVYKD